MAYIGKRPEDLIRGNASYNSFTGDGSTTTFDVTNLLPDGGTFDVEVFVDNVRQEGGSSKSYTIGQDGSGDLKRITFNTAPDDGAEIYVINPGRETSLITVADNTISTAKIQADAITGAKIADDAINSEHITDGSVDNVHLAGSIANSKLANSSITINGTSIALGGSGEIVAGTDWQSVVVADGSTQLTAEAGKGYFLDTNAGVIEVKLPASPSRGDTFVFADYGNNFATNRAIIDTQGKLIDSTVGGVPDSDFVLETNGQVVELVYKDSTSGYMIKQNNSPTALAADAYEKYIEATGGTVTTSGNFKIHVFTGDGCFIVSEAGNESGSNKVDYLVVAGGGTGSAKGAGDSGGGGGAGGFRYSADTFSVACSPAEPLKAPSGLPVPVATYPVTVGGGGSGQPNPGGPCAPNGNGSNGSNSVFSTITSAGGGKGGYGTPRTNPAIVGSPGGSGGGGGSGSCQTNAGGTGNTPPVSPAQGTNGGSYIHPASPNSQGGGGGGATTAGCGGSGPVNNGGDGGGLPNGFGCNGVPCSSFRFYAGGGAGGFRQPSGGNGGKGGGGNSNGAGTANTGGGGGGAGANGSTAAGTAGGKGIVVIRYKFQAG